MIEREPIYAALFDLVWEDAIFKNPRDSARILRHWADVPKEERPALFLTQGRETVVKTAANGFPTVWMLEATIYVYVTRGDHLTPGAVINPILDAISAKLEANARGLPQMLGGLVQWARIEGTIETSEGTLGEDEVALIPVRMLTA
jgi:hypothetical protein